jgi:hypothetical protein
MVKLFCNKRINLIKNFRLKNELLFDKNNNNNKFIKYIYKYFKSENDTFIINVNNNLFKISFSEGYPLIPPDIFLNNNDYIDIIEKINSSSKLIKFNTILDDWYPNFKIYDILEDIEDNVRKISLKHKILCLNKINNKYINKNLINIIQSFII